MPVGQTKDAGWEIGVSRTVPCSVDEAWSVLTSSAALRVWLGDDRLPGDERLRSLRPGDRVRLRWRPPGVDHDTTLQVAVSLSSSKRGAVVRFHQEHLAGPDEREAMRTRWRQVLDELAPLFATSGR
jgi:uncharacterized protein YndB with AHSA1/START domain